MQQLNAFRVRGFKNLTWGNMEGYKSGFWVFVETIPWVEPTPSWRSTHDGSVAGGWILRSPRTTPVLNPHQAGSSSESPGIPNSWFMLKPLFLFLIVFWGISPSRRSLGSNAVRGGDLTTFLGSRVSTERFWMGWIRKIQKQNEKMDDRSQKNKKERMEERKTRDLSASCNSPSGWWPTCLGTSPTTKKN